MLGQTAIASEARQRFSDAVGMGFSTYLLSKAINESIYGADELCPCGTTHHDEVHQVWCPVAQEERRKDRERIMTLRHDYITFDKGAMV